MRFSLKGTFGIFTLLFAMTSLVHGQQLKLPRIGYLGTSCDASDFQEFRRGLRDVGYFEGKNILIECRSRYDDAGQDRTETFVKEFAQSQVDVFVSGVTPAIVAAKRATKTMPIVMVYTNDPVETGIIDSLAKPGGNITGVVSLSRDLGGKRLELLKEIIPRLARVAVLWSTTPELGLRTGFRAYESAAQALRIQLQSIHVRAPDPDFEAAFRDAIKRRADALIISRRSVMSRHRKTITDLANQNRLPSMFEGNSDVEAGGLMAYSASDADQYRRAAVYVQKILKGARPTDLPVEQPTKFEFVVNLKTAKQIGLTIPPNVLARADRVIR